ncbi:glycosyltransferase family 4 protein [Methanobacterium sp.]|uniref:glycosyltransferase family 4 protein n=1 Tax=Methanobacterium sp. TaxID=2164 RepID=UPI0025EF0958|nr:glycosyltransferase family 4 protein [Methanobacterium sp.]MBI5459239.1 glycosyltransferase family 4 protein [Methanobacterium sp.]
MRVLIISGGLPIDYTIQLGNSLNNKGEKLIILVDKEDLDEFGEYIENDVLILTKRKLKSFKLLLSNINILINLIKKIRQMEPDIIHIQGGDPLSIIILPFLKKHTLISTFHDVRVHPGVNPLLTRFVQFYLKKKSSAIIVHGKKLKEIFLRSNDFPADAVYPIKMGEINVKPFLKYYDEDIKEDDSILFFGWIGLHKGLIYLIKAAPLIKREFPNFKIVIAGQTGEGKTNREYFELCKRQISDDNYFVLYPYRISWKFGAELLQKCSLVVLPYIETSQSAVISTAYGFKKPVVITRVGAMPEIVDNCETGLIVPPKDSKSLAKAIIKLLNDKKLRKKMGENAQNKLKTDLSWDNIAKKTIEVYQRSMSKK